MSLVLYPPKLLSGHSDAPSTAPVLYCLFRDSTLSIPPSEASSRSSKMGCSGIFSLLWGKKRSKKEDPTPNQVRRVPVVPRQVRPNLQRHEEYTNSQHRVVIDDRELLQFSRPLTLRDVLPPPRSSIPRRASNESDRSPSVPAASEGEARIPRKVTTEHDLRAEYERCRANAPPVDENFLWNDRRDSLDERSILAALGHKVNGLPEQKPRRHCRAGCICSRCIGVLFPQMFASPDEFERRRSEKPLKRSRIPVPVSRGSSASPSRNASPARADPWKSETEIQTVAVADVAPRYETREGDWNRRSVSSGSSRSYRSSHSSTTNYEREAVQSWWDDFSSSRDPDLEAICRDPDWFRGRSGKHQHSGEWRFIR
ncbi:hypothetical protein F4804DRAFT_307995 [Jackrogersella minutella]|nr:hypothetical protein F4804DRAFT_307995 [Jackrogersella minutella]